MSLFEEHGRPWTTPTPPTKQDPPFWVLGIAVALFVIWGIFKKICSSEKENASDAGTVFSNSYNQLMPNTMPDATIISERKSYLPSSNYTTNLLAPRSPIHVPPSAPHIEHQQPLIFQSTAPKMDEDSIPMFDSPPNYDEAMKILNQSTKES